jgi:hypothetical protein
MGVISASVSFSWNVTIMRFNTSLLKVPPRTRFVREIVVGDGAISAAHSGYGSTLVNHIIDLLSG